MASFRVLTTSFLLVCALAVPAEASAKGSRATAGRGDARAVVTTRGRVLDVRLGRGKAKRRVSLQVGGSCPVSLVSAVVAQTVSGNRSAFSLAGNPTVRASMTAKQRRAFERTLATLLASGRHGVDGKRGFTEVAGFEVAARGRARGKRVGEDSGGGTFTVTTDRQGVQTIVRERAGSGGVRDLTTVVFGSDGSSEMTRALSLSGVTVTQTSEFDAKGGLVSGNTTVEATGGLVFSVPTSRGAPLENDQSSEPPSGGEDNEQQEESGGEDNEQQEESGDDQSSENDQSPSLSSDGSASIPAMRVEDVDIVSAINWNRLGSAVSDPDPTADRESPTTGGGARAGACGGLQAGGVVPDVKFLQPDKNGWAKDPVPALRGRDPH